MMQKGTHYYILVHNVIGEAKARERMAEKSSGVYTTDTEAVQNRYQRLCEHTSDKRVTRLKMGTYTCRASYSSTKRGSEHRAG